MVTLASCYPVVISDLLFVRYFLMRMEACEVGGLKIVLAHTINLIFLKIQK